VADDDGTTQLGEVASRTTVAFEHSMERVGDALWRRLRRRPYVGVVLTSAAALALASFVGVAEIGVACLAGYGMFKVLRRHEPPSQAFRDCARIEKELGL
jgi:heme O synthase-like polyprenyltransferase